MAGPGGGGRGGGGGRSGGSGFRGHSGGGFRYSYHPCQGWYRHGGQGGGCLSQLIFSIVILFAIAGEFLAPLFGGISGGSYNEDVYQDYVNSQYEKAFDSSDAYEDNLLISVLVDDDHYSYYYIAWVGDHIVTDINHMLGAEGTALGSAMENCINPSSYQYSLDANLAQVMEQLTEEVESLGLESSFTCSERRTSARSMLINDSDMELTDATVNNALTAFTDSTGIPTVIVVEDMKDVFGGAISFWGIMILLAGVGVLILTVVNGIRVLRGKGKEEEHPYHSFDDQY